jgi:hypothetical protein
MRIADPDTTFRPDALIPYILACHQQIDADQTCYFEADPDPDFY